MHLRAVKEKGIKDLLEIVFGAKSGEGALVTELTASQVMFRIVRAIVENTPGTNVVTTSIEHPSAYDAAEFYAKRTGKEFRVAMANNRTGGVDVEEIMYGQRVGAMIGISGNEEVITEFKNINTYTSRATWSNINRACMKPM